MVPAVRTAPGPSGAARAAPATQGCHVGLGSEPAPDLIGGLVNKDQPPWINPVPIAFPLHPPSGDVRPVLLGCQYGFGQNDPPDRFFFPQTYLKLRPSPRRNRKTVSWDTCTPRPRSSCLQAMERDLRCLAHPCHQPVAMRHQNRLAMAAHLTRRHRSGLAFTQRPFDNRQNRHAIARRTFATPRIRPRVREQHVREDQLNTVSPFMLASISSADDDSQKSTNENPKTIQ